MRDWAEGVGCMGLVGGGSSGTRQLITCGGAGRTNEAAARLSARCAWRCFHHNSMLIHWTCSTPTLHLPQLVGGPGTAKTATIQQFLGRFNKEEHTSKTITFSYLTTPGIFQQAVEVRGRG